jgi:FtsP/CotA-like multicopper oxidase with cupredoxin domain
VNRISRRRFLGTCAALGALPATLAGRAACAQGTATPAREIRLEAAPARIGVVGKPFPDTDLWAYNGAFPGPVLRARQGERLRVRLVNRLPQETTIHWHGIRLPNAMDGVPHLTQPPVPGGGEFLYEFDLPDAGTFWYHPHAASAEQLGRGLYGALIVEERTPPAFDRDVLWVLSDLRLDREARITADFNAPFDASHAGRLGNTVLVNGRVPDAFALDAGERVRLRIVNAANARIYRLQFEGHAPRVVALDGHPVAPHALAGGLVLGPGMRADLELEATGEPGRRYAVTDDFFPRRAYRVVDLAYTERRAPARLLPAPQLPANPVAVPDLARAERVRLVLGGGAMRPRQPQGMWSINGQSMHGGSHDGHSPLLRLRRGRSYMFEIENDTAWHHPFHLHGVAFRALSEPHQPWRDTALIDPGARAEFAFVADNPGDWMIHCHILEHQEAGMMAVMRIE